MQKGLQRTGRRQNLLGREHEKGYQASQQGTYELKPSGETSGFFLSLGMMAMGSPDGAILYYSLEPFNPNLIIKEEARCLFGGSHKFP